MQSKIRLWTIVVPMILLATASTARASLLISEVFYDAVGSDDGRVFVELYGAAGTVLDGYAVRGVNGSGGAFTPVLALSGVVPESGFFVVADRVGTTEVTEVANAGLLLNFDFQNGPDSVELLDPAGVVLDAVGYGEFAVGDVFAGEGNAASGASSGSSIARRFANVDTNDNAADFLVLASPTPGIGEIAVPEPGGAMLFGVALGAMAVARALPGFALRSYGASGLR